MLPTFFSYTAIMLFCFLPFLCTLSLVSVRCCALCFCWLIFFSFIHFFPPHFPTNSLIMQLKPSTFPLSSPRSGLILFLIEETEAMNSMTLYGLSLESTFEHLPSGLVSCCLLGSCISVQLLCCSICYTILLYIHLVTL